MNRGGKQVPVEETADLLSGVEEEGVEPDDVDETEESSSRGSFRTDRQGTFDLCINRKALKAECTQIRYGRYEYVSNQHQ